MEWVTGHSSEIMAVFIAAYGLVRAVVALTPTKKDDEWIDKNVNPVTKWLAKIFGLDLKQGLTKK